MDLKTKYMGMELKSPLVPSASPLSADLDTARALEDNGAAAIVMYSLFEEQIRHEARELDHYLTTFSESYSEALSYFPEPESFPNLEAEGYLTQIQRLKKTLEIPVIASLNGVSAGGWMNFAKEIEAGTRNFVKFVLIGVGNSIDESQMEELDDLDTGTSVDIWDHKIAVEMRAVTEIISELVDENRVVAPNATVFDDQGNEVCYFSDGLHGQAEFTMPASSQYFELEVGGTRIKQTVVIQ